MQQINEGISLGGPRFTEEKETEVVARPSILLTVLRLHINKVMHGRVQRRLFPLTTTGLRDEPFLMFSSTEFIQGGLSIFNLYVALSCSSGRETIRLLRDKLFKEALT